MPIEFRCPHCQGLLRTPDGSEGRQAQCPQCQRVVEIPSGTPAPEGAGAGFEPAAPSPNNPFGAPPGGETGNPYQSPTAPSAVMQEMYSSALTPIVPTRMEIGDVMGRAWRLYKDEMGMVILVVVAVVIITNAVNFMGSALLGGAQLAIQEPAVLLILQVIVQFALWLFQIWLNLGQLKYLIKLCRGQRAEFTDIFSAGPYLFPTVIATLLWALIVFAVAIPFLGPAGLVYLITQDQDAMLVALAIGGVILAPVMIFIAMSVAQYQALIVDRGMGAVESLQVSNQVMSGNRLSLFGLGILLGLLILVGCLALCVGAIFVAPYAALTLAMVYLVVTGQATAR